MGRAGGGGGGHSVSHSSGGSHSIGHSSGSHHISSGGSRSYSSSRAGSGSSRSSYSSNSSSYRSGRSYSTGWGYVPPRNDSFGREFARGVARGAGTGMGMNMTRRRGSSVYVDNRQTRRGGCGCGTALLILLLLLVLMAVFASFAGSSSGGSYGGAYSNTVQTSSIARNKLESGNAYINDCIKDEIGWFDNESRTETRLKDFWEETGVQPYIILRDYDSSLTSDAQKEQWALDYYDENFKTENIFLYVYFAERDVDNDVGSMSYAMGTQTGYVMDSEAVEIFWNYLDRYWYGDLSTDDLFVTVFDETANTIMYSAKADVTKSNNRTRVLVGFAVAAIVLIIAYALYRSLVEKNRRAKEKAEEDERILNTPIHDMADDSLTNKYADMNLDGSQNSTTNNSTSTSRS